MEPYSDVSEYIPTEKEIKMAEKELKMELSDNKKKSKPKNKSKKERIILMTHSQ